MILYDEGIRLSEEDIIYYEKELKIKFPPRYAEFLLESNGGTPEEDLVFDFVDSASNKKISTDIREFYIFYKNNESSYDDIIKVNNIMKNDNLIPNNFWIFADDSAGNPICMNMGGVDVGSIFFCDHELEDANSGYLLMSKIANSFDEFLEKLYILD